MVPGADGDRDVMLQNYKEYPLELCSEVAMGMQTRLKQLHVTGTVRVMKSVGAKRATKTTWMS